MNFNRGKNFRCHLGGRWNIFPLEDTLKWIISSFITIFIIISFKTNLSFQSKSDIMQFSHMKLHSTYCRMNPLPIFHACFQPSILSEWSIVLMWLSTLSLVRQITRLSYLYITISVYTNQAGAPVLSENLTLIILDVFYSIFDLITIVRQILINLLLHISLFKPLLHMGLWVLGWKKWVVFCKYILLLCL